MSQRGMLWLGAGVFTIGVVAALAHAQHALSVEIMPPPAPLPAQTVAIAERVVPPRPSVPQLLPPSQLEPTEAILWQVREVCRLLKQSEMTVTELAMRLGAITFDAGDFSGLVVQPASRYFSKAQVFPERDIESDEPLEGAYSVRLELAESRQLPIEALEKAFGKGREYTIIDAPELHPMTFLWRAQPRGPIQCEIGSYDDWRNKYGYKKGVATEVNITRDRYRE